MPHAVPAKRKPPNYLLVVPLGRWIVEVETHEVEAEAFALCPREPSSSGSRWWKLNHWIPLWTTYYSAL